jgi:hypothetical protein
MATTSTFTLQVRLQESVCSSELEDIVNFRKDSLSDSLQQEQPVPIIQTLCNLHLTQDEFSESDTTKPRWAAVFCPSTLVRSSWEKLHIDLDDTLLYWYPDSIRLSQILLSLIHPFLAHNFTISAIFSAPPAYVVLVDVSHALDTTILDLLVDTCKLIHSGPEAILKVLLVSKVLFVESTISSLDQNQKISTVGGLPTCPVCLHRIDPWRLGLPKSKDLCSKFCPPPNLVSGNTTVSCPRQRLLKPWPHPNYCRACQIIQKYWDRDNAGFPEEEHRAILFSNNANDGTPVAMACEYCNMQETLWVCLTCGFVGCGRYSNKHAAQHYDEYKHPFCLELSTLRIWSYDVGEFAHRVDLLECPSSPPLLHPWIVRGGAARRFSAAGSAAVGSASSLLAEGMDGTQSTTTVDQFDFCSNSSLIRQNQFESDYDRMIALNFASVDDKSPKKATMIGEEYEVLLQSALEEQAQHYEGEITSLRATLTSAQVDRENMTKEEEKEIELLQKEIDRIRTEIDSASRDLLEVQAQEAGHRATSQRLLREQQVAQDLLNKIREEAAAEHERGRMEIEELEQQIADLTANQRMRDQFSRNEDLVNSQIFGTSGIESSSANASSPKKGKKSRRFFRR